MREEDLAVLLPLMRSYCAFYEETAGIPQASDDALLSLSRRLLADPEGAGIQLLTRTAGDGEAVGFATIYWSWSTLSAGPYALMNDLFVSAAARGRGLAERLIAACGDEARARGMTSLQWRTAPDNHRAQAVYDRVGGKRSQWLDYALEL